MTQNMIRTAIIGTGGIAHAHMRANQSVAGRTAVVAAVDVDADRVDAFCETYSIPGRYTDVQTMLQQERPALVQIATPPGTHCDLIVQSLEAGAWVLCEKPLCASLAEMDRIEAAEARTGNYCASVFQWRFGSGGQHLKRLIEQGTLGKPLVVNTLTTWHRTPDYYAVPWRGKWATEVGGVLMGHGIHAIDFMLWLMGEWREVRAMIGTLDRALEVEDAAMGSLRFANGAMANITVSVLSPREESYMRFDFQRATVELTHLYSYANEHWRYSTVKGSPYEEQVALWQDIGEDIPSSHSAQLAAMLDAMDAGRRPPVSGEDVRGTLEFLAAFYKSAMTGRSVVRGAITPDDPFYHRMNGPGDQSWQHPLP